MTLAPTPTLHERGYDAADRHAKAGRLLVLRGAPEDPAHRRVWLAGVVAWLQDARDGRAPARHASFTHLI